MYIFIQLISQQQYRSTHPPPPSIHPHTHMQSVSKYLQTLPIFLPVSTGMILWYFTIMITILFNFFLTIIFICFRSPAAQFIIRNIIAPVLILLCSLDILMSLNTSFIQRGKLITNKSIIRYKYIKSIYFVFDVLALVIVICQQILRNYFQNKLPFLNLLVFVKVFKVSNFDTLIKKYVIKSSNVLLYYQIIKHFILLIMVCHIIGSFFFYLDLRLIESQWYTTDQLWVYSSYAYNNIIQQQIIWQYVYSFYYAVVTLSGTAYGDLTPLNPTEVAFTFFSLVLPMLVYAYLFSVVYGAIGQRRNRQKQAKQYKKIAANYFKQSGISQIQSAKFVNYLSYAFGKRLSVDNNYLGQLAPSTKQAYIRDSVDIHFDFSIFAPLYMNNSTKLEQLKQIIYQCTQEQVYPAKQIFHLQKLKKLKLYFIISGTISQYIQIKQSKFNKIIKNTQFFGQYTFYTGISPAKFNHLYQTNQFTICQTIMYSKFINKLRENILVLEEYHNLRNMLMYACTDRDMNMNMNSNRNRNKNRNMDGDIDIDIYEDIDVNVNEIKNENENKNNLSIIKHRCYFCQSYYHIIDKCPHLRINIDPIQSSYRSNARTRIHTRKQKKRYKYYQSEQIKQARQAIFNMFKIRTSSQLLYEDECVQTDNVDWRKDVIDRREKKEWVGIDVVRNWGRFQKEYSFL